jgi:hypothetical protein
MNEQWNTMNLSMLRPNGKGKDEVSLSDINNLLKKRSEESAISDYNEDDVKELQKFCNEHGILGVNFGRMNPKAALNMLKGKMGIRNEPVLKRGLING